MATTTVILRLTESEKRLLADHAKMCGMSMSEFVRIAALSHVEGELDAAVWEDARRELDDNLQTLTATEIAAKYL